MTSCGRREQDQPKEVKEASVTGMRKEEGGVKFSWGGGRGPFPPKGFVPGLWIYLMYVTLGGTRTHGSEVLQSCLSGDRRLTTIPRALGPGSCLLMGRAPHQCRCANCAVLPRGLRIQVQFSLSLKILESTGFCQLGTEIGVVRWSGLS